MLRRHDGSSNSYFNRCVNVFAFWSRKPPPVPQQRIVSKEASAGIISQITFQWVTPVLARGSRRALELNDLWLVPPQRQADVLSEKLETSFTERMRSKDRNALRNALYDTLRFEFVLGGICQLIASLIQVINPFVLRYLIRFSAEAYYSRRDGFEGPHIGYGVGLVFVVTVLQIIQSRCSDQFLYRGMMTGGQARAALICLILDKSLKLSARAKAATSTVVKDEQESGTSNVNKEQSQASSACPPSLESSHKGQDAETKPASKIVGWDNGKIINLMSTDASRVASGLDIFHMSWTAPVSMLTTLILLLVNIKESALPGFCILLFIAPALRVALKNMRRIRRKINLISDRRVSFTQEIFQAVRLVKYLNWERYFINQIENIRKEEIDRVRHLLAIRNGILSVFISIPILASVISFITYGFLVKTLDPALIFSSFALFNAWRLPLSMLPRALAAATDASSSLKRIQDFLQAEEADEEVTWDFAAKNAIVIENGCYTWEQSTNEQHSNTRVVEKSLPNPCLRQPSIPFKIQDLQLSASRNDLIAVVGRIGSGKSSLLSALAGDMRKIRGSLILGGSRAFCPQLPWIMNASIKENIILDSAFDQSWYGTVLDACALRPDLTMLPDGDLTQVGERGITLSGGQKQRLNLARGIYSRAEIILLDDPLSAVDAHTGKHIMTNAICGVLRNKCRILATHQLWALSRCDKIVHMDGGRIIAIDDCRKRSGNEFPLEHAEERTNTGEDCGMALESLEQPNKAAALMQDEEMSTENLPFSVYAAYGRATGSIWIVPGLLGILVLSQGAQIVSTLWLAWWIDHKFDLSRGIYLAGYTALGVGQALFLFVFAFGLSMAGTAASKALHHQSFHRVLGSPVSFFDTTPIGRIINRFSRDVDILDSVITDSMQTFCITTVMICSVFVLIVAEYYWFAIALVPLMVVFFFTARFYRGSARDLKRHDSILRSFVFSRFSEAVNGVASIRAYGLQKRFSRLIREALDEMDSPIFLSNANQRWFSARVDLVGTIIIFVVSMLVVTSRVSIPPSTSGLVLSYLLFTVQLLQYTVRQFSEVEKHMNATERIHHYAYNLEQEAPAKLDPVRASWPSQGQIVFKNVEMRYRPGLPLRLRKISLQINGGERFGIVGRTGAGKSSIITALFRINELSSGSIFIDDVNISTIGLDDLRSQIAIIPQDPILFTGTIRSNLDPSGRHSDDELRTVLTHAGIDNSNHTFDLSLDSSIDAEGSNVSHGQRQLLALARALIRRDKIIVCDEATSNVDIQQDKRLQLALSKQGPFRDATVICIAHRLRTILQYDRICVIKDGVVAELGSPLELFSKENGIFQAMCAQSSITRHDFDA